MSTFVLCVGCGEPLYGFSPCQWCTYEGCGNDLLNGFCSLCNSRNSCVYNPNPNSFDCPPDSCHPPHPTYETYSGDSCGNDSHFGYDCPPRFLLNYEPKSGYIQHYNSYPNDSPSFPQQYLCCDNYGGLYETFQCQLMNQNFYNSNSLGFDQTQPPQFPVIHSPPQETSIKILHDQENAINSVQTFLRKFNRYSFFEMPKVLLLAWDRVFKIKDAFGNKQYKSEDIQNLFRELFNNVQNIHEELAMYINTLGWNRPVFYNNCDDDDEDCTIAITPDFLITDSLIMGTSILTLFLKRNQTNSNIDSLLAEFAGEFIPPGIDEADCDPEEDIHLVERLLYDNSSPRPREEFVSKNSNAEIEYFSSSPILVEDRILNIKMMGDIYEQKVPIPRLMITLVSNQEKSPDLLSHRSLEIFQLSAKCPMMIHGKNIPILDVPLFHFYPLDQFKYEGN
nr:pre-mRNA splicing Prp18-interacting factor [Tanacetum cinerariifolium]